MPVLPLLLVLALNAAPPVRMGSHGMVLFGQGSALYASHIPMFHPPHDVQLLLQVELTGKGLPADFARGLYTLDPERFDLSQLMAGKVRTFHAALYRGSFDGGGTVLQKDVTVRVRRVLHAAPLKADAPALPQLRYLVVGEGREGYLVHALGRAPDFDQVLRATFEKPLPAGVHVLELPRRENAVDTRLTPGAVPNATLDGAATHLEVAQELSFLRGPDFTP
ncbi:hypothetical protein FGE12_24970 [Aggregicoccus sp. 17bor-14]|uniref:hypothetical protein n=1 Tax=Myxococcaceae TaxID=31 RepID=UPI00129D1066|nr:MULTISPECIES: hypothetical protein [Myxococcaceae]MBF5045683.1 hypothetical protein [Simulacricoccus sp. 17bor-14]MRI91420.1 hypothetical protein [Aggregicoccus sp. 17bor-14]